MISGSPGNLIIGVLMPIPFVEKVCNSFWIKGSSNGTASDRWKFLEPGIIVANELVYYLAQNTYTSTCPWIVLIEDFELTLEKNISSQQIML
jgi:hypothetical protein